MDSTITKSDDQPASNMTRLPSIHSLMPQNSALHSPTTTPPTKSNRLPSYSPENTLAPIASLFPMANTLAPLAKQHLTPDVPTMLSPPTSPWTDNLDKKNGPDTVSATQERSSLGMRDPILFPSGDKGSTSQYLHPTAVPSGKAATDAIAKHLQTSMVNFTATSPPSHREYMLALACVPSVGRAYNKKPGFCAKRQLEEEADTYWRCKRLCAAPGQRYLKPKAPVAIIPRPIRQPRKPAVPTVPAVPMDRPRRTPKPTPKASPEATNDQLPKNAAVLAKKAPAKPQKLAPLSNGVSPPQAIPLAKAARIRSQTPEVRAPVAKSDDKDYNSLKDYSPSLDTLINNPHVLKTEWASPNPYNLANDPDLHLLHPSEVKIAEILRLCCAQYLCSKRRIFWARLNALRIHKTFRKTDAQKACKIDVNKASKLFAAFEKVGWFDEAHFKRHLCASNSPLYYP